MKDYVFADKRNLNGKAFAGADNAHNYEHNGHNSAYAADNPAENRNNAHNGAKKCEHIKNHYLVEMITNEFGIRLRNKADYTEKNAQIAELKKQNEDWEKEYYNYLKQIDTLQQYIDQVHTENGSIDEINRLKKILTEKNDLIGRLQRQTKIYEEECNLVMEKESPVDMLKQIEILTSQIKSLQSQLNDLITYDRRIASFDDFIKVIEAIKKNSNDQSALSKLNYLIDFYKKNNEIIKNSLILEMHK